MSAFDARPVPFPTGQSQSRTTFHFTRSRACARVNARHIAGEDLAVLVDDADLFGVGDDLTEQAVHRGRVVDHGLNWFAICWGRVAAARPRRGGRVISRCSYSIHGMNWGTVELEPEVRDWLEGLSTTRFATAAFYVDLLAEQGPLLGEPYTRQLDGKLRELRFHLGGQAVRVTYWIASGRRIVLLTVFAKTRMRETREIERARQALRLCILAEHTADEDGEE